MAGLKKRLLKFCKKTNKNAKFAKYWPVLVIIFVGLVFFYPIWLQNKVPLPVDALVGAHVPWTETVWEEYPAGIPIKNQEITDSFSQFYPWRSLVGEFWRVGKAPLWNPYMFSGTPFLATLHSASLYPLNTLYLFLSNLDAWVGLVILQIFLASIFMYFLLRELNLTKWASVLGAIAFAFSGYMIAWLEFATGGHAGLWLPLLLYFELKLVNSGKTIWTVPISAVFFFIYTAGDFQVPFYITLTYLLFGGYLLRQKGGRQQLHSRKALLVVGSLILGMLLSLPQLLPVIELFTQSVRANDPYIQEYYYGLMHWEKIVNFVWPDFFGNVVTRNYWGKYGYHEYLAFVGIVPLIFVSISIFTKKLKHETFFWVLLVICLIFLFPTPLAFLPYKLNIPGLGTSSASRVIFLVDFCLAVLAAYGFSKWTKNRHGLGKVIKYLLAVSFGVGLGLTICVSYLDSSGIGVSIPILANLKVALRNIIPSSLVILVLGGFLVVQKIIAVLGYRKLGKLFRVLLPCLIVAVTIGELLRFAWKNTPFSLRKFVFPETRITRFLQEKDGPFRIAGGIPLNLFMPYNINSAEGYDPIYPKRNSEWFSLVNSRGFLALSGRYGLIHDYSSPLIDFANVAYVVDYKKNVNGEISEKGAFANGVKQPKFREVFFEGRIKVFENTDVLPRVFVSGNYKIASNEQNWVDSLFSSGELEDRQIVLESNPSFKPSRNKLEYSVTNFVQGFNRIDIDVANSGNGLLFLSESYYPGWEAYINGRRTKIFRANYIFKAIQLPEGNHHVEFIYNPNSFRIGKTAFFAVLVFLAGVVLNEKKGSKGQETS
jgi:hypothetical protein